MIDIKNETLLSLSQAAKRLPSGQPGKATHVSTIHRWIQKGLKGVQLEAVKAGGRWLTSYEALQRFTDNLAGAEHREIIPASRPVPNVLVSNELDRLGF